MLEEHLCLVLPFSAHECHARALTHPAAAVDYTQKTTAQLQLTKEKLANANVEIAVLRARHDAVVAEEAALESRLNQCKLRADNAAKLTAGLEDEARRWADRLHATLLERETCVGDTLLCAATVCYAAPLTPEARDRIVGAWVRAATDAGVGTRPNCRLSAVLGDAVKLRQWRLCGLPADGVAEENAIMLCGGAPSVGGGGGGSSTRPVSPTRQKRGVGISALTPLWPLIVDPQGQASR